VGEINRGIIFWIASRATKLALLNEPLVHLDMGIERFFVPIEELLWPQNDLKLCTDLE
jgi:hypothetical protein